MSEMIKLNKRGAAGRWIGLSMFIGILILISVFLSWGFAIYFGEGYDFNQAESEVLFLAVEKCFMKYDFFEEGVKESIYEVCNLNKNSLEEALIYAKEIDSGEEFFVGIYDFKLRCQLYGDEGLGCFSKEISKEGKTFQLLIVTDQSSRAIFGGK